MNDRVSSPVRVRGGQAQVPGRRVVTRFGYRGHVDGRRDGLFGMPAQPLEPAGSRDPGEDPAAIFDALPPSHRAEFRAEYDEALDAAHDLARFKQVQALLRQWRLRAIAYARPGYEEAVQDAHEGRAEMFTRYVPLEWEGRA